MAWKKLAPITKPHVGCLNCGPRSIKIKMNAVMAVGFGAVIVKRDRTQIWSGDDPDATLMRFENMARKDPDHDWRVFFHAPMSEAEYQRHGKNEWVMVKTGMGFA